MSDLYPLKHRRVYLIIFETEFGPICSSEHAAEEILNKEYGGQIFWLEEQSRSGFPTILPVIVDDDTFCLDRTL